MIIEKTIEEILILHKQGDENATVCLLKELGILIHAFSKHPKMKCVNEDFKSEMILTSLKCLDKFDVYKYLDKL